MKTVKAIKTKERYTLEQLLQILKDNIFCLGEAEVIRTGKSERIIFPDTQRGRYILSIKPGKKIHIFLGEHTSSTLRNAFFDELFTSSTYWQDKPNRKALYRMVSDTTKELALVLNS